MYFLIHGVLVQDFNNPGILETRVVKYDPDGSIMSPLDLYHKSFEDEMKGNSSCWGTYVKSWSVLDADFKRRRNSHGFVYIMMESL